MTDIQDIAQGTTDLGHSIVKCKFYYGGACQALSFSRGSTREVIVWELVRQFRIDDNLTNRKDLAAEATFLDVDGNPFVFDPSSVPDDFQLSIVFPHVVGLGGGGSEFAQTFEWDSHWNSRHCGYAISDGGRTISLPPPEMIRQDQSMPILISNRKFDVNSEKLEFTVVWEQEMTYHSVGLVSAEEVRSSPEAMRQYGLGFGRVPVFEQTGAMGDRRVKVVLDMQQRKAVINNKTFTDVPAEVYIGICFKMPHSMRATMHFEQV